MVQVGHKWAATDVQEGTGIAWATKASELAPHRQRVVCTHRKVYDVHIGKCIEKRREGASGVHVAAAQVSTMLAPGL